MANGSTSPVRLNWRNKYAICVDTPTATPLTGKGSAGGTGEIIGYLTCPTVGSTANCLLSIIAYMPWAKDVLMNVQTTDLMGLAGQWTNISGGLIGKGGGSKAVFSNTSVTNTMQAFTYTAPATLDSFSITPQACSDPDPGITSGFLVWPYLLLAEAINSDPTGESNNLTNGPATLTCSPAYCQISFVSTAP